MKDKERTYEFAMMGACVVAVLNMMLVQPPACDVIALVALVVIAVLFVLRLRLGGKWFE